MTNEQPKLVVPVKTLQTIVDYLMTRPYGEVSALINELATKGTPFVESVPAAETPQTSPEASKDN